MSGAVRRPRLTVLANGVVLPGVVSAELRGSGGFEADRFRVEAALGADPRFGLAWWDAQERVELEVRIALDGGDGVPVLRGEADQVEVDPVGGRVVADGRDLSARLIDAQTNEAFVNQTAGEVASLLAARHGLQAAVTATATPVGRYYGADHAGVSLGRFARTRSEWDLLAELALREGHALYVSGTTLHFEPQATEAAPFVVGWDAATGTGTVESLQLDRLPRLGRGVQVIVRSWGSRQGNGVTAQAGDPDGAVSTILRPNLTAEAAQALAARTQSVLAAHARGVSFTLPGELGITPRSIVRLEGDLAGWAGSYRVTEVTRRLDGRGFRQHVSARAA